MAAKPPLLHDRTENALMQKQFSCTISYNPFII